MEERRPRVAIAMGDPAGIGAEITVEAVPRVGNSVIPLVVGDADTLRRAIRITGIDQRIHVVTEPEAVDADTAGIPVIDLDNVGEVEYGAVDRSYGRASMEYLDRALALRRQGRIDAVTWAPFHRESRIRAEAGSVGGLLERHLGTADSYLLLLKDGLRVSHVTDHVPLGEVPGSLAAAEVTRALTVTDRWLRYLGVVEPEIAVAGVNPHAGYGGAIGTEEDDVLRPAIAAAEDAGLSVVGPESPDSVFGRAVRGVYDGVLAMYHDQGHIAIKTHGAGDGRQFSGAALLIGLPAVISTVAHGSAFGLAGTGRASSRGLENAIRLAGTAAANRPSPEDSR